MMTITIAGGSGFLGQILENYFTKKGDTVYIITRTVKRKNDIYWNAKDLEDWTKILEQTDVLINLTGKSVDCRYTEDNKKQILNSLAQLHAPSIVQGRLPFRFHASYPHLSWM